MSQHSLLNGPLVPEKPAAPEVRPQLLPLSAGRWTLSGERLPLEPARAEKPGLASPEEEALAPDGPPSSSQLPAENPKYIPPTRSPRV